MDTRPTGILARFVRLVLCGGVLIWIALANPMVAGMQTRTPRRPPAPPTPAPVPNFAVGERSQLGAILINSNQYATWFTGSPSYVCGNIGRRPAALALDLLPDWLAEQYCWDVWLNNNHANSYVYKALQGYYTLQELEAADLWGRLSKRAAELGLSCGGK